MKQSAGILRRFFTGTAITVIMVVNAFSVAAQTADEVWGLSQRHMSSGARMTGMSIRGLAGFGDYSAIYGNPAGLGYVSGTRLIVSLRGSETESVSDILANGFNQNRASSTIEDTGFGSLAFLYSAPVKRGKLVGGLALSQVRDFSREVDFVGENTESSISTSFLPFNSEYSIDENGDLGELADLPFAAFNGGIFEYFKDLYEDGEYPFYSAVTAGTLIEQSARVLESGAAYELNAAVAWQATRDVMIGGALNIFVGDYNYDYSFIERDILNENTPELYNVLLDDGTLLEGFNELEYQQRLNADMAGINFRLGMSAKLNNRFRVGVTLESPTWSYFEESYGEQFTTQFDLGGSITYGDHAEDVGNGFFEYSARSPWRLGAGVRVDLGIVMLTGEGEIVDWSQLSLNSDDGGEVFRDVNRTIDSDYGIALNYAFGIELELGRFDLRTGLAVHPSPYIDSFTGSTVGGLEVGDRMGVSVGAGVRITDGIRLDLALHSEDERDFWNIYPSDAAGPRQTAQFEMDEQLRRGAAILQLTVRL